MIFRSQRLTEMLRKVGEPYLCKPNARVLLGLPEGINLVSVGKGK